MTPRLTSRRGGIIPTKSSLVCLADRAIIFLSCKGFSPSIRSTCSASARPNRPPTVLMRPSWTGHLLAPRTPWMWTLAIWYPKIARRLTATSRRARPRLRHSRRAGGGSEAMVVGHASRVFSRLGSPAPSKADRRPSEIRSPRPFRLIFEVRAGRSFLKIESKNEAHSTRIPCGRLLLEAPVWRRWRWLHKPPRMG